MAKQPHSQKELHAKRKKESYAQMEPAMEKKVLCNKVIWYKSLGPEEKEKLLSHTAKWYKSLDPKGKEKLFSKSADCYKSLGSAEKQYLLSSGEIWYNHWILHKSKREQNGLTCSILLKSKKSRIV